MTEEPIEEYAPYRRLYLSILLRAVEDAGGKDLLIEDRRYKPMLVAQAKAWLTRDTWDLRFICGHAGVSHKDTLERYRRMYGEERHN